MPCEFYPDTRLAGPRLAHHRLAFGRVANNLRQLGEPLVGRQCPRTGASELLHKVLHLRRGYIWLPLFRKCVATAVVPVRHARLLYRTHRGHSMATWPQGRTAAELSLPR